MNCSSLAVILALAIGSAVAQTKPSSARPLTKGDTIWIGMELQLGMEKEKVISRLASDYKLTKIQIEGDDWFVQDKNDPLIVLGNLGFTNGRLTYAAKTWTPSDAQDGFALAQAIHGALTAFARENKHLCYMDTDSTRNPDNELKHIYLSCGGKRVDISITEVFSGTAKGRYVEIHEVLSSERNR